jgi:hypothetical protein
MWRGENAMSNLRFAIAAVVSFGVAFVVMSFGLPWASKALMSLPSAAKMEASTDQVAANPARSATVEPNAPEAKSPKAQPRAATQPKTAAAVAPAEPARDRLAQTALQAAQAYAGSPCDRMAKTAFIVAASTYLRAQDASSKAPKDARVHDAIKTAFENGNVSLEDFPPDVVMANRFTAAPSRASCINSAGLQP